MENSDPQTRSSPHDGHCSPLFHQVTVPKSFAFILMIDFKKNAVGELAERVAELISEYCLMSKLSSAQTFLGPSIHVEGT